MLGIEGERKLGGRNRMYMGRTYESGRGNLKYFGRLLYADHHPGQVILVLKGKAFEEQ